MPTSPIIVPIIILFHTIQKHIPKPKINALIIMYKVSTIVFKLSLIGALCSSLRQINIVIKPKKSPILPKIIPSVNLFQSATSAIHIPSENKTPLIVPITKAMKLLFFIILNLLSLNQHLWFLSIFSIINLKVLNNQQF